MSRAGSRERRYRNGFGRLSKEKIALVRTSVFQQLAVQALNPEEWDKEFDVENHSERGTSFVLLIPVPGRTRPLAWNISAMTFAELDATRKFFEFLFDQAEPVVKARDKEAADAFAKGDDTYVRSYRQLPQLIIRSGEERKDSESVQYRPEDPSSGDTSSSDSDGGL